MFWGGQAYLTYRLGGAVSELLYSPATYGIDYGSSAGALPRPRARANPMMAVCGNTLCLLGGVVEVRTLRTCPFLQPAVLVTKQLAGLLQFGSALEANRTSAVPAHIARYKRTAIAYVISLLLQGEQRPRVAQHLCEDLQSDRLGACANSTLQGCLMSSQCI